MYIFIVRLTIIRPFNSKLILVTIAKRFQQNVQQSFNIFVIQLGHYVFFILIC